MGWTGLLFLVRLAAITQGPGELLAPVRIEAGGQPLDVKRVGHSAPFLADVDQDGRPDLLVGQFHEGRLRIYRNEGTEKAPRYGGYRWFTAASELGRVPTA
jgi:hypothetical protein